MGGSVVGSGLEMVGTGLMIWGHGGMISTEGVTLVLVLFLTTLAVGVGSSSLGGSTNSSFNSGLLTDTVGGKSGGLGVTIRSFTFEGVSSWTSLAAA